jgi:hypothetical protein
MIVGLSDRKVSSPGLAKIQSSGDGILEWAPGETHFARSDCTPELHRRYSDDPILGARRTVKYLRTRSGESLLGVEIEENESAVKNLKTPFPTPFPEMVPDTNERCGVRSAVR